MSLSCFSSAAFSSQPLGHKTPWWRENLRHESLFLLLKPQRNMASASADEPPEEGPTISVPKEGSSDDSYHLL